MLRISLNAMSAFGTVLAVPRNQALRAVFAGWPSQAPSSNGPSALRMEG
ncbi:hypothetical protein BH24ACT15_BH24ACT15_29460 [soil metagenome]|jgi:hypothetical protein